MIKYTALYIAAIALLLLVYSCSGISLNQRIKNAEGDWLEAGGSPKHQNVSSFILEPPLDVKWSFDIDCGIGYSGISVSDAVVFVNCLAGEMYSFDISGGGKLGKLSFLGKDANSTPLINGNDAIVSFAGDRDYSLASYNLETGLLNWRINIGFLETSPVLYNGFIYVGSLDGNFYKVDIKTDSVMWKYNTKAHIHSTCAIDSNSAVFGADNGNIYCINLPDGSLKWKTSSAAPVVATPLIADGKVFIGSYDSAYYCLNLSDGSVVWKKNMSTKILGGSSLFKSNDIIFGCVNGILYSLKAADGTENWRFTTQGVIGSSPLCSGYNIYFTSYDFNIYCLDGTKGTAEWSYNLEGKSRTSPVIWKDYLIACADKEVFCFTKNGNVVPK